MMMADCEANYARICRIMPSVLLKGLTGNSANNSESNTTSANVIDKAQEHISFDIDLATNKPAKLSLSIAERCRFTTMVNLQVLIDSFVDVDGESGCVNMSIRLYHDVNMAEVKAGMVARQKAILSKDKSKGKGKGSKAPEISTKGKDKSAVATEDE